MKHTKAGEEIVLGAKNQDGNVRFSVIDRGSGIPPQYQAQLFDRFFRVPGSEVTGAGLGLAIAKEIVLAQGGTIGVNSTPGRRQRILFRSATRQQRSDLMSKKILVVDDEPNVRLNYRMTLETEGYTVLEADCGAKALETIRAGSLRSRDPRYAHAGDGWPRSPRRDAQAAVTRRQP